MVRLRPGQDLRRELLAVAERERIRAGWVVTGVGSLSRATLRLAGAAGHARLEGTFEIVSLVGTLSQGGDLVATHARVAGGARFELRLPLWTAAAPDQVGALAWGASAVDGKP